MEFSKSLHNFSHWPIRFYGRRLYWGKNKAEFTSLVINRTINDLIFTNSAGDKIKDRVFISLIGYGGKGGNSVDDIRSDYLSAFADSPLRIEK